MRPRDLRTSSLSRARSFTDSAAQRLPTITVPCSNVAHGTTLRVRASLDPDLADEGLAEDLPGLLRARVTARW